MGMFDKQLDYVLTRNGIKEEMIGRGLYDDSFQALKWLALLLKSPKGERKALSDERRHMFLDCYAVARYIDDIIDEENKRIKE